MVIVIVSLLVCLLLYRELIVHKPGYVILKNMLGGDDIKYILELWNRRDYSKIKSIFMNNQDIQKRLPPGYVLLNYSYIIEDSSIHTYHRDYTSSKNYNLLEHPSYTLMLYLDEEDNGLNVIPGSHLDGAWFYIMDKSKKLKLDKGSALLFDADLLHAGSVIKRDTKRHCIQFKVVHKDDVDKMLWLHDFHVLINKKNDTSAVQKKIEIFFTKHFPLFMDLNQGIIKSSFSEEKSDTQKWISKYIFSDDNFYKPIRI